MMQATQLANVTVHTVDPNAIETTNVHAGDDFKPEESGRRQRGREAQERANRAFLIERQQSLQTVADWTGGRAILNTNVPEESVRPILDESSAYYLLAFQASDVKPDGRFHPITVKVNRPDVQVRTRKGYYADAVTPGGWPARPVRLAGRRRAGAAAGTRSADERHRRAVPRSERQRRSSSSPPASRRASQQRPVRTAQPTRPHRRSSRSRS